MNECPTPHSRLHTTGYVPSRIGVARKWVVMPGTASICRRKAGIQKAWMTSLEWMSKYTDSPLGTYSE